MVLQPVRIQAMSANSRANSGNTFTTFDLRGGEQSGMWISRNLFDRWASKVNMLEFLAEPTAKGRVRVLCG